MSYTVKWEPDPVSTLSEIWLEAADRKAITAAQARIDRLLASDPLANATFVSEGLYGMNAEPLRVLLEISIPKRVVKVVSVGLLG